MQQRQMVYHTYVLFDINSSKHEHAARGWITLKNVVFKKFGNREVENYYLSELDTAVVTSTSVHILKTLIAYQARKGHPMEFHPMEQHFSLILI